MTTKVYLDTEEQRQTHLGFLLQSIVADLASVEDLLPHIATYDEAQTLWVELRAVVLAYERLAAEAGDRVDRFVKEL